MDNKIKIMRILGTHSEKSTTFVYTYCTVYIHSTDLGGKGEWIRK